MRRLVPAVALPLLLAASAQADWGQWRHDAAHTGCTDEALRPPLELRWRFVDDPDPRPERSARDTNEQLLRRRWVLAFRGRTTVRIAGYVHRTEIIAANGLVLANRVASGSLCLDAGTGETRWRDPAGMELRAIEGQLAVASAALNPRGSPRQWATLVCDAASAGPNWGFGSWTDPDGCHLGVRDPATGRVGWAFTPESPRYLSMDWWQPDLCGVREGLVCVRVGEWHVNERDRTSVRGPSRAGPVDVVGPHSESLCFLRIGDGYLVSENECLPQGRRRKPCGCSLYYGLGVGAWSDELMLLSSRGPADDRSRLGSPLWAMTQDGETLVAPRTPGHTIVGWAEGGFRAVLVEGSGLALVRGSVGEQGVLACREARSGRLVWTWTLSSPMHTTFPPAVSESAAYFGLADGKVYSLDLQTGEEKWSRQVGEPLEEPLRAASFNALQPICSLTGDALWVVYRGSLLALNAGTGKIEWQTDETEAAWYEPVISDGQLYLSTIHGIEAWGPDRGHSTLQETPDAAETGQSADR